MSDHTPDKASQQFESLAAGKRHGLARELWNFALQTRKWWLLPIIVVLLGIGLIIVLGGTAAAPFIYTLF